MSKYRRLSKKDEKKLKFINFSKTAAKVTSKWFLIVAAIIVFLGIGIALFYNVIDNREQVDNPNYNESSNMVSSEADDESDLTDSEKNELDVDGSKGIEKNGEIKSGENKNETEKCLGVDYDFSKWNESCKRELVVVNKFNLVPESYKINTKLCRGKEIDADVCPHLEKMISDARKEDIIIWISSGYRSVELQNKLFYNQVAREKNKALISDEEAKERAKTVVAFPKTSEHNTGLAVDFNGVRDDFCETKEYQWLVDNAHKYGFIERYREKWQNETGVIYEPWHFRYVGQENSLQIKESGLSLEEYVYKNLMKTGK